MKMVIWLLNSAIQGLKSFFLLEVLEKQEIENEKEWHLRVSAFVSDIWFCLYMVGKNSWIQDVKIIAGSTLNQQEA